MHHATATLFACLLPLLGGAALPAQQIVAATSGLPNPTTVYDFGVGVLPNFTPVTTQFAGLTITHAAYFTTGSANNLNGGFLTNDFRGAPDTLQVQFAAPATDISFVYHQVGTSGPSTIRILLQGNVVDSFSGTWNQAQSNNWFGFTNTLFDELQVDFVTDFNVDTIAVVDAAAQTATCVLHNGTGVNPVAFTCQTLPVLGSNWQGAVAMTPNTILTFLAFAPGGLAAPSPLFGGELLIATSPAPAAFAAFGSYSVAIPASSAWTGTVITFQGFRVDSVGGGSSVVPLNAQDLVLGL